MSGSEALDSFVDKWRARWPEWQVAGVFVAEEQRRPALAWFAVLQEFDAILNIDGDPLPADAKLGWWATELRDWARHRSRHPLGRVLEPLDAPWERLADALPDLPAARARPHSLETALAGLAGYARAAAEVEAALFGGPAASERALAAQVLAARLAEAGMAALPETLASAGAGTAAGHEQAQRDWARQLLEAWPRRGGGPVPRRVWAALARERLRQQAVGRLAPGRTPWRTLWQAWRAAALG